jgi:hypothetical protein
VVRISKISNILSAKETLGAMMINLLQLDLLSLRLLVLAAESENLTKAADGAHMTVSAASKRLAELERITDCTLFVRLPRGLQLTPAGRGLAEHARHILESAQRMAHDASDFSNGVRGHVRLFANTSAVIQFLPGDLNTFLAANPVVSGSGQPVQLPGECGTPNPLRGLTAGSRQVVGVHTASAQGACLTSASRRFGPEGVGARLVGDLARSGSKPSTHGVPVAPGWQG